MGAFRVRQATGGSALRDGDTLRGLDTFPAGDLRAVVVTDSGARATAVTDDGTRGPAVNDSGLRTGTPDENGRRRARTSDSGRHGITVGP